MDAKKLTDTFWELFEAGRIDDVLELMDADCHFKMPGAELRGREALAQLLGAYRLAFPDMKHRVTHHVASGDTIAIELAVEGTHTGPMHTPHGVVPATGRRLSWESCDYIRVRDGRIVSWHVYHDPTAFNAALAGR